MQLSEGAQGFVAGLIAAGVTLGVLAYFKQRQLKEQGAALTVALQTQGQAAELLLAVQGEQARAHLENFARLYATDIGERAARQYIDATFGPRTREAVRALPRVAARLGL